MNTDALVIGSGISGLTAAALLAKQGKKVIILEKNNKPGGALKRFSRKGISFDVGFHYTGGVGQDEILRVLWDYIGILPYIKTRPFPEDGCDIVRVRNSQRDIRCYFSYRRLEETLQEAFPEERHGIAHYLKTIREICDTVPFFNLKDPLTPFLRGFFPPAGKELVQLLSSCISNPDLHAILSLPVFLYGVSPRHASIATHAMVAHGYYSGAYSIERGGQGIVDGFVSSLDELDVEIRTGWDVETVIIKGDRACGVITPQGEITANDVIFTGHPLGLLDMVPENLFRPAYITRVKELKNTCSMFVVFGEMSDNKAGSELAWTNRYSIPSGFDLFDIDTDHPDDLSLMLTAPGMRDSSGKKNGTNGVILLRPAQWNETSRFASSRKGSRPAAYREWKEKNTEILVNKAHELWGEFGEIKPLASGSPLTFRDELGAPEGAAYGVQHRMDQFITGARTRIPGLWLSGQSTLMTGILGASISGLVTAGEICGLEPLWNEVLKCR